MSTRLWAVVLCALLAGCSIDPPKLLEKDPALAELGEPFAQDVAETWDPPSLAVAPVRTAYMQGPKDDPSSDAWTHPPINATAVQRRLQKLLRWSLLEWDERGSARNPDWPTTFDLETVKRAAGEGWTPRVCGAADDAGAQLVARLEIEQASVSFVERTGMWWLDLFLYLGVGVLPVVAIPDELYRVDLRARFAILSARPQRPLFEEVYEVHHEDTFNDFQRGFSFSSLVFLHEALLRPGEDDFGKPLRALLPHALKELERRILVDLRRELPGRLETSRELLDRGERKAARTYALLVAAGDPEPWTEELRGREVRPKPLAAAEDVRAFAQQLRESGTVQPKHLKTIVDARNAAERLRSNLRWIGQRALRYDRVLIQFSGYGTTTVEGEPALVLGDGLLQLSRLAAWCREELRFLPSVVFILDTSFGKQPADLGRNYRWADADPGGDAPEPGFLSLLGDPQLRWVAISAAAPDGVAYELHADGKQHGYLTRLMIEALGGAADATQEPDGLVTIEELAPFLRRMVPKYASLAGLTQVPRIYPEAAKGTVIGKVWSQQRGR